MKSAWGGEDDGERGCVGYGVQSVLVSPPVLSQHCTSHGEIRVSCFTQGEDPEYSWTLNNHPLDRGVQAPGPTHTNNQDTGNQPHERHRHTETQRHRHTSTPHHPTACTANQAPVKKAHAPHSRHTVPDSDSLLDLPTWHRTTMSWREWEGGPGVSPCAVPALHVPWRDKGVLLHSRGRP
ncbi:hypothetical protein JZ751_007022 [Albula glossodonta]|uniref:Uncharacterized protein n=1 Tax=Albula glossodonta TaxID=121402 RepID=A0A8T2PB16_9TELE|nr:hypothetical protein JZ751_007022 [Albula glossodonta]